MTTTTIPTRFGDDIHVGDTLEQIRHTPSNVQLFRYCAVTWNSHRIHYDTAYAATEGYPDVLVQSHLHGAFLTSLCTDWMGAGGRLERLEYSVRKFACPGDTLVCGGEVISTQETATGERRVTLRIREVRESDGVECATGEAAVILPRRGGDVA